MRYLYNGSFSIEDGEKEGEYQQWLRGKIYDEAEIKVSSKRIKRLINLGYLKPVAETVKEVQKVLKKVKKRKDK